MTPALRIWIGTMFTGTSALAYHYLSMLPELTESHAYLLGFIGVLMICGGLYDILKAARRPKLDYRTVLSTDGRWKRSR